MLGQNISSTLVREVTDATGSAVPRASITVTNQGTGISKQAASDASGSYSIPNLPAGIYTIMAKKEGFQLLRITGVRLLAAEAVRQDLVLRLGSVHQAVTVIGKVPLVNTESATIGATLSSQQIADLPITTQSIDGLLNLVPGAQTAWGTPWPRVGGALHAGSINFTINGLAANDPGNGAGHTLMIWAWSACQR
jgi:hypothetical protein